jgi:tetrahydromethanopterin S-methyltransferase subunit G
VTREEINFREGALYGFVVGAVVAWIVAALV